MIRKKMFGGKVICHSLPLYSGRRRPLPKPVFALGVIVFSLVSLSIVNTQQLQYLEYNALLSSVLHDYSHESGPHLIGDNLLIAFPFEVVLDSNEGTTATDSQDNSGASELLLLPQQLIATQQNHTIGVAFLHEHYATIHPMQYNSEGLYFVSFPVEELYQNIPLNTNTVYYRIIVNGIWTHDRYNPYQITDYRGFKISAYELPTELQYTIYPTQRDGAVHFVFAPHHGDVSYLSNTRGQRVFIESNNQLSVTIAGTFNRWDPYLYPMQMESPQEQLSHTQQYLTSLPHEVANTASFQTQSPSPAVSPTNSRSGSRDGSSALPIFTKSLSLPPGEHYYYFVVNGTHILDPHNSDSAASIDGRIASRIVVE